MWFSADRNTNRARSFFTLSLYSYISDLYEKKKLIWVEFLIRGYVNTKSLRSPDVGLTSFAVKRELPDQCFPNKYLGLILFGRNRFREVIKHSIRD
jgi:hypothetical protein